VAGVYSRVADGLCDSGCNEAVRPGSSARGRANPLFALGGWGDLKVALDGAWGSLGSAPSGMFI
jgi:hypothetical protein